MWDDLIIGAGDRGGSASKVYTLKGEHSISRNDAAYWIDDLLFGYSITIFRNTSEGRTLDEMIDKKVDLKDILDYLNTIVISNISLHKVKEYLENRKVKYIEKGKKLKERELRIALGIV